MSFKFLKAGVAAVSLMLATFSTNAYSAEINTGSFSGTVNTTISSGLSIRVAERDCTLIDGWTYSETEAVDAAVVNGVIAGRIASGATPSASANLTTTVSGSGEGCASKRTDNYGNAGTKYLDLYGNAGNDGNLNFDQGDVFSATQKMYSEIVGTLNGSTGVRLSFVGSVNPALDISSPAFKQLNSTAEDAFESDITLLDAYITESFEVGDTFIDVQAGRFVTSWGEATFLPLGMNGMVTNAIDLSKIRSPGASIKEALMPTEQVSLSFGLADGTGIEVYTQINHDRLQLDPNGSFFGSEVFGPGANSLLSTGANYKERMKPEACPYVAVGSAASALLGFSGGAGLECNQAVAEAQTQHATNWTNYNTTALAIAGFGEMGATEWAAARAVGAGHEFTSNQDALTALGFNGLTDAGSAGNVALSGAGTHAAVATAMDNLAAARYDMSGTVDLFPDAGGLYKAVSDEGGQFGIRFSKYLDNVGSGVDVGLYYAKFHSKVPYAQFSMPGSIFAGDILGAYLLAFGDAAGTLDDAGVMDAGTDAAGTYQLTGTSTVHKALSNAALSSGLCSAIMKGSTRGVMNALGATNFATGNSMQTQRDSLMLDAFFTDQFDNGDRAHDASECFAHIDTLSQGAQQVANLTIHGVAGNTSSGYAYDTTQSALVSGLIGTGARLFAAVTPINMITYQGIFPEDNEIISASISTNVGSTVVQAELSLRPDFPLATDAGDQINQLNDKNGSNDALNFVAIAAGDAAAATADLGSVGTGDFLAYVATAAQTAAGLSTDGYFAAVGAHNRSTLGDVWDANGASTTDLTSRYYSKPYIKYDVWSGSLGTTTSFQASHPLTQGIGADSAALLTELGFVRINGLDNNANGYVARGGANEGPQNGTSKCLGVFGTSLTGLSAAAAGISNLGAGIVDALFGNGGYCESEPGADEMSMTYRVIGTANYSNFMNSPWSLSPNFSWAHDFEGYGPSSLGGFIEDRMTLSLGASLSRGGTTVSGSLVNFIDDAMAQPNGDKDYLSLSVSHTF